jgi:TolB-like protein
LAIVGTLLAAQIHGQEQPTRQLEAERLAVLPFINATGDPQWDSLADSMSDTIDLTVRLSAQFDVREIDAFDPYSDRGLVTLAAIAQRQRIGAVVFGRIAREPNGRIALTASVFGVEQGRVIGEQTRVAFGEFDILDAADELVLLSTSAIVGYRVDYGALVFQPDRDDVPYRVFIDGVRIGDNVETIPQVLFGRRTIEIAIVSGENEQIVYSADRLVRPGEAVELAFSLPSVIRTVADEIRIRHTVARTLLGQYEEAEIALEALAESRALIRDDGDLIREQAILESAWALDDEYATLDPARYSVGEGDYQPGTPFSFIAETVSIAERSDGSDPRVSARIERNAATHMLLIHLHWAQNLARSRWNGAVAALEDMEALEERFNLARYLSTGPYRENMERAVAQYRSLQSRRTRPWPYLTGAIGVGVAGFGGYLLATDAVGSAVEKADDTYDDYQAATDGQSASRLRGKAQDQYDQAELLELAQWGALSTGGVVAILSAIRVIQNRRAGDTYLRRWAREQHGREIDIAERILSDDPDEADNVAIVVLGPVDEPVSFGDRIDILPAIIDLPAGRRLDTNRPWVVVEDGQRLYGDDVRLAVVR